MLGKISLELCDNRQIGLEHVEGLLRKISHVEAGSQPDAPGIGRCRADNHLEQGSLARAVSPHHRPTLSAADNEIKALIDHALAVALVQVLDDRPLPPQPRWNTTLDLPHLPFPPHP